MSPYYGVCEWCGKTELVWANKDSAVECYDQRLCAENLEAMTEEGETKPLVIALGHVPNFALAMSLPAGYNWCPDCQASVVEHHCGRVGATEGGAKEALRAGPGADRWLPPA